MGAATAYQMFAGEFYIMYLAHLRSFKNFVGRIEEVTHSLHFIYFAIPELLNIASNGKIGRLHLFRSTVCREQGLTLSDAASFNLPHRG